MSTIAAVLAATPSPSPTSAVPDVDVTPGVVGFIAIALVAVATILLIVDMTRRIRRTRYRAEIRERLESESRGDAPADGPAEPGRTDVGDDTERG
ncbi:hypothetical protein [Curtobacterium sp. MCBA15_001]|uniref:hypothetical protein n=1 Tax=Curtobacterium sp. MCBA15_001 TaxID=1898731 RepID=UPI0008DE4DB8|nr:hypothetical protein [Curtobacterium sp. MCBA15_001]OIH94116.1 hypothetical protein BIU90_06300 [Curtobacterium sp. MCBA15_001]